MNYPPLPPPDYPECFEDLDCYRDGWSADQMRAYVDADRAQRGEPVAWIPPKHLEWLKEVTNCAVWREDAKLPGYLPLYLAPPEPEAVALLRRVVNVVSQSTHWSENLLEAVQDARAFLEKHRE